MIRGLLSAKLRSPEQVVVFDAAPGRGEDLRRRFGVSTARSVEDLLRACDTVVVAVKPQSCRPSCPGSPGTRRGERRSSPSLRA